MASLDQEPPEEVSQRIYDKIVVVIPIPTEILTYLYELAVEGLITVATTVTEAAIFLITKIGQGAAAIVDLLQQLISLIPYDSLVAALKILAGGVAKIASYLAPYVPYILAVLALLAAGALTIYVMYKLAPLIKSGFQAIWQWFKDAIGTMKEKIKDLTRRLRGRGEDTAKLEAEIKDIQTKLEMTQTALDIMTKTCDNLRLTNVCLEEKVADVEAKNVALEKQVEEKDAEIRRLRELAGLK